MYKELKLNYKNFLWCFSFAAIWQLLLALVQAGKLSWMFSDIAMSGYTAGAGIGIFTSQVKTVLGLKLKRFSGILSLVYVSIIHKR